MKVLALIPDFLEKPSGGLGEQMQNIIRELKNKVEYYICGYPEKNNIDNYKSIIAPFNFEHVSLTTIYGQSIYFLKALEFKQDFDIIHACDWSTFYAGVLASWHFKKPLVCTVNLSLEQLNNAGIFYCHDPYSPDGYYINRLQVYFEHMGLIYANKIIHVSDFYLNLYPDYKDKSVTIHNGLDLERWQKQKDSNFLLGKNKTKFCYIGRASTMKGIDMILESNIPDDIDFYFVVSEKNAEEPIFTNIKNKCNHKNIFHIQGLYGQDKIDFLYEMDAVVMPSIHEPFGIVALEAMASESILITTAKCGIKEIVEGTDYVHLNNVNDLNHAYNYIKLMPEHEKNKIKQRNKNYVSKFDWKIQSNKLYELYKEVMSMDYNPNKMKLE
jgi:glycosyltransferase involved in cell wall biosynthesis